MGNPKSDNHNDGQAEGSSNGPGGHLMHELVWRHVETEEFNEGYDNGRNNPSRDDSSSSGSGSSGSGSSGGCYITTACSRAGGLADDCNELKSMRKFRDDVLLVTPEGRQLVEEYYVIAPRIVARVDGRADASVVWAETLSSVRSILRLIESGRSKDAISAYRTMAGALDSL